MDKKEDELLLRLEILNEPVILQQQCITRLLEVTITPDCAMKMHPKRRYTVSAYAHDRLQALYLKEAQTKKSQEVVITTQVTKNDNDDEDDDDEDDDRIKIPQRLKRNRKTLIISKRRKKHCNNNTISNLFPLENSEEHDVVQQLEPSLPVTVSICDPHAHSIPSSLQE